MNLSARAQYLIAVIGCIGAIGGPTAGAVIQAGDNPKPASVSCAVVAQRAADFARDHPSMAQEYVRDPQLQLATESEIEACGDPEKAIDPGPAAANQPRCDPGCYPTTSSRRGRRLS